MRTLKPQFQQLDHWQFTSFENIQRSMAPNMSNGTNCMQSEDVWRGSAFISQSQVYLMHLNAIHGHLLTVFHPFPSYPASQTWYIHLMHPRGLGRPGVPALELKSPWPLAIGKLADPEASRKWFTFRTPEGSKFSKSINMSSNVFEYRSFLIHLLYLLSLICLLLP